MVIFDFDDRRRRRQLGRRGIPLVENFDVIGDVSGSRPDRFRDGLPGSGSPHQVRLHLGAELGASSANGQNGPDDFRGRVWK
jgi:hypothetical protein